MTTLISAFVSVLALLVAAPTSLQVHHHAGAGIRRDARERLAVARDRLARHEQALAAGDPSRSPYHRFHLVSGQNGSRHADHSWHHELLERS